MQLNDKAKFFEICWCTKTLGLGHKSAFVVPQNAVYNITKVILLLVIFPLLNKRFLIRGVGAHLRFFTLGLNFFDVLLAKST